MAVTVDDLPGWERLSADQRQETAASFLAAFKKHGVSEAYGFVVGRIAGEPGAREVLSAWLAAGHALGSHSYSHAMLSETGVSDYEADIARNEAVLREAGAKEWRWFRYPNLDEGDTPEKRAAVRAFLKDCGYRVAGVTTDFADYRWEAPFERCSAKPEPEALKSLEKSYLKRALSELDKSRPEHILLLHFTPYTARMLDRLLASYEERGARFVKLGQVPEQAPAKTEAGGPGKGLASRLAALCPP